jgi:xanthine dehydrogenase molybdopterin-binding subunit B
MKNINKWISYWNNDPDKNFYDLIEKIQIDAYNQGIEDAAEEAIVEEINISVMSYYQVDKQSILDLKIKNNETESNGD